MATIIPEDEFVFKGQTGPKSLREYPFEEWFDGRIWRLAEGVDFPSSLTPKRFGTRVYSAAKLKKCKVRVSVDEKKRCVVIQAYNFNGEQQKLPEL